jgi:hypothetical protein
MEQQVTDILAALTKAANQLGVQAIRLWPEMVRVTFIKGLTSLMCPPLVIGLLIWLAVLCMMSAQSESKDSPDRIGSGDGWAFLAAGMAVVAVMLLVVWVVVIPGAVAAVLAPEATTVLNLIGK